MIEKKLKEETGKSVRIGKDMLKLIKFIQEKFEKEYGFQPPTTNITNLIAKRVNEKHLF